MRSRIAALGAMLLSCALPAFAQFTTVSASNVGGAASPAANAIIYWQPVTAARIGSAGGQVLGVPYQATVTAGAFSISVPDTLATDPTSCYAVTVIDKLTGATLLGAGLAGDGVHVNAGGSYGCVQPAGSTWNFDSYVPPASPPAVYEPTPGPIGPPLNPRGAYSSIATYATGDLVSSGGSNFACITGCSGVSPIEGVNWELINIPKNIQTPVNVMSYGATGNGTADDTSGIDSAIAALSSGGALYFPAGVYKVSSVLAISVPVTIYGDGDGSSDFTQPVSQVSCSTSSVDCFKTTGKRTYMHDLAVVNTSSGTPTGGAGLDFCYVGAYQFPTFDVDHVTFGNVYTGISSCKAENAKITDSNFLGVFYDGLYLSDVAYNSGDTVISGNMFSASGTTANAAIDFEGSTNARIFGNKTVSAWGSPPGEFYSAISNISAHPATSLMITGNDFESISGIPINLTSGLSDNIDQNTIAQTGAVQPPIQITANSQNINIGTNMFENLTGSTIPETVLINSSSYHVVVMPQNFIPAYSGGGYTAAQSGITTGTNFNFDYSGPPGSTCTSGTFTPTDQSGAALTFAMTDGQYSACTNGSGGYNVTARAAIQFPSTSDAHNVLIGGLPFTVGIGYHDMVPSLIGIGNYGATLSARPTQAAKTFDVLNSATGASITNATFSGTFLIVALNYSTQ